jgi:hypothetical protein
MPLRIRGVYPFSGDRHKVEVVTEAGSAISFPSSAWECNSSKLCFARMLEGQGSGVRFFEIGWDRVGFKNETQSGQFRKIEHLTPDATDSKA